MAALRGSAFGRLPGATFIAPILSVLAFVGWHFGTTREFSASAALFLTVLCMICHVSGALFLRLLPIAASSRGDYPIAFLLGYLIVGVVLYALALVSPFGVKVHFTAITAVIAGCAFAMRRSSEAPLLEPASVSALLCVAISVAAATLWAQDSLTPINFSADEVIFTHWPDSFFHARQISAFANQKVGVPIEHLFAAGEPMTFYHYASYMLPAALTSFAGTTAYDAYSCLLLPAGILLTGLAAFSLGKAFWGHAGSVAATVALLLLPDAAQQGTHNYWYSYHWLQHVNPGQMYGVAILAVAWVYMFDGCKTGRLASVGAAYALAAMCVTYKAHYFVANALLIFVFPALFFGAIATRKRVVWAALCIAIYWLALKVTEGHLSIPTIKLDGTGILTISKTIIANFDSAALREHLFAFVPRVGDSRFYSLVWASAMAVMIFVITLGWFGPLLVSLAFYLRNSANRMTLWFPFLVIGVFLLMSVGLAANTSGHGYADELMHRPFAWAYFVVSTWTGGAFWFALSKSRFVGVSNRASIPIVALLLAVPWHHGKGIEVGPSHLWTSVMAFSAPGGLVQSARFIRNHSNTADIVQDSQGDENLILTALAERQPYVINLRFYATGGRTPPTFMSDKWAEVGKFKNLTNVADIAAFASRNRIRWFVVHPDENLAWPLSVRDQMVFEANGYRVYRFDP